MPHRGGCARAFVCTEVSAAAVLLLQRKKSIRASTATACLMDLPSPTVPHSPRFSSTIAEKFKDDHKVLLMINFFLFFF